MKLKQRKLGWIGVDVGTSMVNIAQIVRAKHGWQVAASSSVPRQQSWLDKSNDEVDPGSSLDELQAVRSLQQDFHGRDVAATLPMVLCDIHRLDRDLSREPNALQILRQTIETATQEPVEQLQCDYWSGPAIDPKPAWSQALTVSRSWTDQLCADIAQVGWSCGAIDGLPLTIARAINMVHPADSTGSVAALDWGNGRATLCFIEDGQPTYVRCLKNCGLRNMINSLVASLRVSELEAERLLEDYGVANPNANSNKKKSSSVAHLVQEVIADSLHQLVGEIKRSISHFQYIRRSPSPQKLYLLGCGAMISSLDAHLAARVGIKCATWQLRTSPGEGDSVEDRADCLLAKAIALSALAWEES